MKKFIEWVSKLPLHFLLLVIALIGVVVYFFWSQIEAKILQLWGWITRPKGGSPPKEDKNNLGNYTEAVAIADIKALANTIGTVQDDEAKALQILRKNNGAQNRYMLGLSKIKPHNDITKVTNFFWQPFASIQALLLHAMPEISTEINNEFTKQP